MKYAPLFFILFACSQTLQAQKDVGGYLSASVGVSLPTADFASTDPGSSSPGYAGNGLALYAIFGHRVHGNLGVFGMFSQNINPIARSPFINSITASIPTFRWNMKSAYWDVTGLTFGLYYSFPMGRWDIDARVMTGGINFNSPKMVLEGENVDNSTITAKYTQETKRANSLTLGAGATVKYEFTRGWVVQLNVDYMAARPTFTDVETIFESSQLSDPIYEKVSYSQKYGVLLPTVGVGVIF